MEWKEYDVTMLVKGKNVLYRLNTDLEVADCVIPAGFVSDGASVPKWFWSVFPPVRDYFGAAVKHDYDLKNGVPWMEAANSFNESLTFENIKPIRRVVMVTFVKLYGIVTGKS